MHFLYLAAILNGLTAPLLIVIVWWLARDRDLMKQWRSKKLSQTIVLVTALTMIALPLMWLVAP